MESSSYESVIEEQAQLIRKNGTEKRKSLISKETQYFDSTELGKYVQQTRDIDAVDPQVHIN